MPRPNYVNYAVPPDGHRERWLKALCDRLGLEYSHRDYLVAIDTALAAMVAGMVETQKREDEMYYQGEDRVKQVNVLQDMAANIRFSSDDPTYPIEERVDYYIGAMRDEGELPTWFDDHDRNLLIRFASDD